MSSAIRADDLGQHRPVSVAHRGLKSARKIRPRDRPLPTLAGVEAHADDPPRLDPGEPGRTHERKGRRGVGVGDGEERSSAGLRPQPPRKVAARRRVMDLVDVERRRAVERAVVPLDQEHVVPIDGGSFGIRNARAGDEKYDCDEHQRRRPSHGSKYAPTDSLELRHAWGGEPVPPHAPGQGFGEVSVGRGWNNLARGHSVLGIVSDRAARVVVRTAAQDDLEAVVLAVPDVGSAMKAFVAFTPYDEAPRSISALDQDEAIVAMHDLPPS
jgi:hypothetical protein